jgi:hypothetical protein
MTTQTTQTVQPTVTTERQDLYQIIDTLSDDSKEKLAHYVEFLRYQEDIPNAETIAAIEECRARKGKKASNVKELLERLNNDEDD